MPFPLLHGPFLFIYTSLLLHPNKKISRYWPHFVPFVVLHLLLLPFYSLPTNEKLFVFQNNGVGYEQFVIVNAILIFLSGIAYFTISYVLIYRHKKQIKHSLSQIEGKTLDWLRLLSFGIGAVWLFIIVGDNDLIFSGVVLFIVLIGIFGIRQNNVFSNFPSEDQKTTSRSKESKYEKSGLSNEKKASILKMLEQLIKNDKPYLNPELSLTELAELINTQANYLSQVLNEHFELNFYDFINSKRIEEFCGRIKSNAFKNYKLMEIAYDCGFNSKSAFNRNFKRIKGKTPSEYQKEVQKVPS